MAIEIVVPLSRTCASSYLIYGRQSTYLPRDMGLTDSFDLLIHVDLYGIKNIPIKTVTLGPFEPPQDAGKKTGQQRTVKERFEGGSASVTFAYSEKSDEWRQMTGVFVTYELCKDKKNPVVQKVLEIDELQKRGPAKTRVDMAAYAIDRAHEVTRSFDSDIDTIKAQLADLEERRRHHLATLDQTIKNGNDLKAEFDASEMRLNEMIAKC